MSLQTFEFEGQQIEFDLNNKTVMVNATEMAAVFGKLPKDFLKTEDTKNFISECLKKENYPFISVEKEEDLYVSRQKSGTWMHRILALKFAAWLNPAFELWVYATIDDLLFGSYKHLDESLRQSAERKLRIAEIEKRLMTTNDYLELEQLKLAEKQAAYLRSQTNKTQIQLFQEST